MGAPGSTTGEEQVYTLSLSKSLAEQLGELHKELLQSAEPHQPQQAPVQARLSMNS